MREAVVSHPAYREASCRLHIVLEPGRDHDRIRYNIGHAQEMLPDAITVGMTTMGPIASSLRVPTHTSCSFLLFEHSTVHVHVYDCHATTLREAGRAFADLLDGYEDVRGVLCMTSYRKMDVQPFVDEHVRRHKDVPLFGALAGTYTMDQDLSAVFANGKLYDKAILAVVFCGEDLHIKPNYNLGWRAIGNEHVITKSDDSGYVHSIDGHPAVSFYRHYLKMACDQNFFVNVCSFPLVMPSGEELVAHVPVGFTENGSLRFPNKLEQGSHVFLSYAHPNDLMQGSIRAANEIAAFAPQALLLFSCLNRRVFFGNTQADKEVGFYRRVCPSMAWGYGYGEIMHTADGGGLLNSTVVAFGMREGEPGKLPEPLPALESHTEAVIPLSDRLATFLEATTDELNQTIRELETLAKRDSLTGAVNRRRIDEVLHYELTKRRKDLVLLMYDIDFFKDVNDTYGHNVGDIVLKDLTHCVQTCIREGDTLARWGGEEFLCLLVDLNIQQARKVAERIRTRVEQTPFLRVGHITVSIGITAVLDDDTPESFFDRADQALYDAKHDGRNCVRER